MKPADRPPFRLALSDLDRERFGVCTAQAYYPLPEQIALIRPFCLKQKVDLCIARCFADEMDTVQQLQQQGFALMDTSVHWVWDLDAGEPNASVQGVWSMRSGDEATIYQIAKAAFHGYRSHYYNDTKLPRAASEEVYADWARRETMEISDAHEVLVVESADAVAGFITLTVENKTQARVVLVAVSPSFQRQGLLQRLLIKAGEWARAKHLQQLVITTQLANAATHKACQRLGFTGSTSTYTLHAWFK